MHSISSSAFLDTLFDYKTKRTIALLIRLFLLVCEIARQKNQSEEDDKTDYGGSGFSIRLRRSSDADVEKGWEDKTMKRLSLQASKVGPHSNLQLSKVSQIKLSRSIRKTSDSAS